MVSLFARIKAKPGKENYLVEEMTKLANEARKENGCINYIPHKVVGNPFEIAVFEQYVDQAALEHHKESPHFKSFVEIGKELIDGPLEIIVLKEF